MLWHKPTQKQHPESGAAFFVRSHFDMEFQIYPQGIGLN
jgi:hypothetical protein